jgi:hypothetical protein
MAINEGNFSSAKIEAAVSTNVGEALSKPPSDQSYN